jgi:hypothetical protein
MGISNWGNKGSVIKGEVDVMVSCGDGSDGGSIVGIEWGLIPRVIVAMCSWLGLSSVSFEVDSIRGVICLTNCGNGDSIVSIVSVGVEG